MTDAAMTLHTRLANSAQQAYICQVKVGWHIVPKFVNGSCVIGLGSCLLSVKQAQVRLFLDLGVTQPCLPFATLHTTYLCLFHHTWCPTLRRNHAEAIPCDTSTSVIPVLSSVN